MARFTRLSILFSLMFVVPTTCLTISHAQQRTRGNAVDDIAIIVDSEVVTRREWNQA